MDDMIFFEKYGYDPASEDLSKVLENVSKNVRTMVSEEVLMKCFSLMDITSLNPQDTEESITKFVKKVNSLKKEFPEFPSPASICVYPVFAGTVSKVKASSDVHTTAVAACFPSAQSFIEVKLLECRMAVRDGADEIDVVMPLNWFMAREYEKALDELCAIRSAIDEEAAGRKVTLKVILETGILSSPEMIAAASFLAMEAGADFIKTSTGKVSVNATPAAAYIMCRCIRAFYEKTGRKVGFKAAGGISEYGEAVAYYLIVLSVLGKDWLCPELFRFGVSRLANSLISAVSKKTVKFF